MRFFSLILSFNLIMSLSNDLANREVGQDQSFILQTNPSYCRPCNNSLQDWRLNDMQDRIEQNKEVLR